MNAEAIFIGHSQSTVLKHFPKVTSFPSILYIFVISNPGKEDSAIDNLYNAIDSSADPAAADPRAADTRVSESPSRNLDDMYAKVIKKAKAKDDARRRSKESISEDTPNTSKYRADDPGYETIDRKKSINHGYETITRNETNSQNQDPGYETVKDLYKLGPNAIYANNNLINKLNNLADSGPSSLVSSDPGYEHISKIDHSASDSDPNYEVLRNQPPTPPYATIAPNYKLQPAYSTVNKNPDKYDWSANNNDQATQEPNYESMPHEPLYNTGSESDPNYESVRPKDPNYESVSAQDPNYESLKPKDPKYESVRSKSSARSDPNYESVKYFDMSKEPPYEKVHNGDPMVERADSTGGYERINVGNNRDPKSSISNGTDATVSDYFQV